MEAVLMADKSKKWGGLPLLNQGPRLARVCPTKDCSPRWRSFGDPKAVCPEHKRGVDQADVPYPKELR
jgi:hypothetical protein